MELDQLRQFIAVAEAGTSLSAAEKLHVSQSSISRSLRKLEAELGCELFKRTKNRMELNDDGRWVLSRARDVVREADELVSGLRDRKLVQHVVHLGSCAPAPLWRLMPLLAEWDPEMVAAPESLDLSVIEGRLADGSLDMAIWPGPNIPAGTVGIPLLDESLQVVLPVDHPLAGRDSVSMTDLDGETFLLYAGVGVWKDSHLNLMPNAHYIVIDDILTFSQVASSSPLPRFTTKALDLMSIPQGFSVVDLSDDLAHIEFYLIASEDSMQWGELFCWLQKRLSVL